MTDDEILAEYYMNQATQSGGGGFDSFYSGPVYQRGGGQRGAGIGSFLSGLFRTLLPILKRGSIAVGKEILNSGTNFINDVSHNANPRTAFNTRAQEAITTLKRKAMHGEGYKAAKTNRKRQLSATTQSVDTKLRKITKKPTKGKKKSTLSTDIFSKL